MARLTPHLLATGVAGALGDPAGVPKPGGEGTPSFSLRPSSSFSVVARRLALPRVFEPCPGHARPPPSHPPTLHRAPVSRGGNAGVERSSDGPGAQPGGGPPSLHPSPPASLPQGLWEGLPLQVWCPPAAPGRLMATKLGLASRDRRRPHLALYSPLCRWQGGVEGRLPRALPLGQGRTRLVAMLFVGGPHQLVSSGGLWVSGGESSSVPRELFSGGAFGAFCLSSWGSPEAAGLPVSVRGLCLSRLTARTLPGSSGHPRPPRGSCCTWGPVGEAKGGRGGREGSDTRTHGHTDTRGRVPAERAGPSLLGCRCESAF